MAEVLWCEKCGKHQVCTTRGVGTKSGTSDVGRVECVVCKSEWCYCRKHGRYRCPPPCPKC
jgi:hypothetical protein